MRTIVLCVAAIMAASYLTDVCGANTSVHVNAPIPLPGIAMASTSTVRATATAHPLVARSGQPETLTAAVWSSAYLGPVIVDFEIDDGRGAKVYEKAKVVQLGADHTVTVTKTFIPTSDDFAGTYSLNIGVFGPTWKPLYSWISGATSFLLWGRARPLYSASGSVVPSQAYVGQTIRLTATVSVKGPAVPQVIADLEVYHGARKVYQITRSGVQVSPNSSTRVTFDWRVPRRLPPGDYVMTVGVFGPHWAPLYAWNGKAARLTVV